MPKQYGVWLTNSKGENILWNTSQVKDGKGEHLAKVGDSVTLADVITTSTEKFKNHRAVGARPLIKREMEGKFEKLTLGDYQWMTYNEWGARISAFGSGLKEFSGIESGDRMLIYAETQRDWMTAAFAGWKNNFAVVTAYATLGAEGAKFAINQTKSPVVVADAKLLKVLLTVQPDCPCVKTIITITEVEAETKEKLESSGVKVATFDEIVAMGTEKPVPDTPPTPDDTAVIMFTSGTTGVPKGVVISHANILATVSGLVPTMEKCGIGSNDIYCSYLPLAHIMEIVSEINLVSLGACMGYGNPHTLTDTGVKLKAGTQGDLPLLKPTFVIFAPLVLEKIYNSISVKTASLTGLKKMLFTWGIQSGQNNFENGHVGASWFYNTLVFKKIQAMVGGKLRFVITGSAPLDGEVHKFIQTALCAPVRQGYGLTETCAASVVQDIGDNTVSNVGPPLPSVCIKLIDWNEYKFSDRDDPNIKKPRGEICIGGPTVTQGYLVDPENPDPAVVAKNKEEFFEEDGIRWFRTGDIGAVSENGTIAIVDRKKDLVKLQQGEYVALSKVEGVVKLVSLVENALCHADPKNKYCTVLVCPMLTALEAWGKAKGFSEDAEGLCGKEELGKEILAAIGPVAKGKLAKFEIPTKVYVVPPSRTWTPENDLLTAAMKLKRKPIEKAFAAEIEAMYA